MKLLRAVLYQGRTGYSLLAEVAARCAAVIVSLAAAGPAHAQFSGAVPGQPSSQQGGDTDPASKLPGHGDFQTLNAPGGPVRLRSPNTGSATAPGVLAPQQPSLNPNALREIVVVPAVKHSPGEFEAFVQRQAGSASEIRRFGAELMTAPLELATPEVLPSVPSDYLIKPGDEIQVTLWGSVDADLRLVVDRGGRIALPRVGAVQVAGVRYADLASVLKQRVARVFRNFELSVAMGQLRGQRVYITGFVARPGTYHVSSLATVVQALLQAGGPASGGSMRQVELRRGSQSVAKLDLYDVLLRGDRSGDLPLQAEDVIHVAPVGPQVGLIGSVNRPAVFELKANETLGDVIAMGGGVSAVADPTRVAVERLDDRATVRVVQLALPAAASSLLRQGDVIRVFSAVDATAPVQLQNKRVRIEGEVLRPGEYVLPPASTIADAIQLAGGLTQRAYVFGTDFSRESVRMTQQQNYERALRDLEADLARSASTTRVGSAGEEAALQSARDRANTRLIASLRAVKPTGRVVLQVQPDTRELPALMLEDGDRLYVPPRPTSVGVFGSVFNGGSFLYSEDRTLDEYLHLAGGPTRGADERSTFVIRANGSVVSSQQRSGLLGLRTNLVNLRAEPGDTIFVPEELDKTTFVQGAKDWTQILYQFGLGIAGIVSASR
jgi:protein involved in polysaccharide export with SLBB domain